MQFVLQHSQTLFKTEIMLYLDKKEIGQSKISRLVCEWDPSILNRDTDAHTITHRLYSINMYFLSLFLKY